MYVDENGNLWAQGNLHTHTTDSDGRRSPAETVRLYRELGYDFLALTEHWKWSDGDCLADETGRETPIPDTREARGQMLLLPGVEFDFNGSDVLAGVYHVVAVGANKDVVRKVSRGSDAAACVREIHRQGGFAILAHPAWSMNTHEQIMALAEADAAEIYNTFSGLPCNVRPDSGALLDLAAARGCRFPLLAGDDTHFHVGELGGAFLRVRLEGELSRESLTEALRAGRYYASQGPHVESARTENGVFRVRCPERSRVTSVRFFTADVWSPHRVCHARPGGFLTEACFPLTPFSRFVRAELVDEAGRRAWTQYAPVEG